MSWRDSLRPASFRGISFRTDAATRAGGRRGQTYEFPKRNEPLDEDLGRRARRFSISGYVIGPDHVRQADRLQTALEGEGPAQLVTNLMGSMRVRVDTYTRTERRQEGGVTFFDMTFSEAGRPMTARITEASQGQVLQAAKAAEATTVTGSAAVPSTGKPLPPPNVPQTEAV